MCQQIITSTVDGFGCYDMVACTSDILERISDGGSTGSNCQSGYSTFKGGYALFKNSLCRVSQTTVDISRVLQAELWNT